MMMFAGSGRRIGQFGPLTTDPILTGAGGGGIAAGSRGVRPDPFAGAAALSSDIAPFVAPQLSAAGMPAGAPFQPDSAATPALAPPPNPGFFSRRGGWLDVLGGVADAVSGQPIYASAQRDYRQQQQATRAQQALWARDDAHRQQDRQWQVEDRDAAMNKPQFFNAGNDRVRYDPVTGQSEVVYDAPEDYQTYASTLGLNPGDAGYDGAVQDYVLRGSGPTAQRAKLGLEGVRQDNRLQLRGTPTYRQAHPAPSGPSRMSFRGPRPPSTMGGVVAPILAKMAQGQPLSAGEQQALSTYQAGRGGRRGGGGGASASGGMPTVRTPAEARALPPGTRFRTPDGREMVR